MVYDDGDQQYEALGEPSLRWELLEPAAHAEVDGGESSGQAHPDGGVSSGAWRAHQPAQQSGTAARKRPRGRKMPHPAAAGKARRTLTSTLTLPQTLTLTLTQTLTLTPTLTLYHEVGHALHALLSRTEFQHLAGVVRHLALTLTLTITRSLTNASSNPRGGSPQAGVH